MNEPSPEAALAPWLAGPLRELLTQRDRLHHALLIHGPAGIGKSGLARHLAAGLFCEASIDALACGQCPSCGWMKSLAHPDLRLVIPEALDPDFVAPAGRKPSNEIRIEQIRALAGFTAVGGHRGGWRIVLIDPADAMNTVTANSLLKTLEEPGKDTLLMLVTSHPDRLPATIRSRCRSVGLRLPDPQACVGWLIAQGAANRSTAEQALRATGSPMHALGFIDPARLAAHQAILEALSGLPETMAIRVADLLERHDARQWADVLQRWVSDLTRVRCGAAPYYFPDQRERMRTVVKHTDLDRLTALQQDLSSLGARIDHPLNARLLCESSIFAYCEAFDAGRRA